MKSFREIIKDKEVTESPVGMVGRTRDSEALSHIESSELAKEFRKIVKKLGGKNVARQLLAGMNNSGKKIEITEKSDTMDPSKYLREAGYKIKNKHLEKYSFELEFFKETDAKNALEDLKTAGFLDYYNISGAGKIIGFENI